MQLFLFVVREVKVQSPHFSNDGGATPSYTGISHDVVAYAAIELGNIYHINYQFVRRDLSVFISECQLIN